ncbi:MAG: HAD-IIB family hydrolase [Myxococcales bacterium]|nr:HAD-IIB family hydrolase [Myxococcales bacterium]
MQIIFTDIDDTLTHEGMLKANAFQALWDLYTHGVRVVPVTGRPAGWCDHIARMWPVSGVIGENGALAFRYDRDNQTMDTWFAQSSADRTNNINRLATVKETILREVPRAQLASDQPYRLHDLAIDYCEDVPRLSQQEIQQIVSIFAEAGATAKVSSIHINGWFGTFDKLSMMKRFAKHCLQTPLTHNSIEHIYIGDSPNDEPAFSYFARSIGVANIRNFADNLQHPPTFVTTLDGGFGFSQVSNYILESQGAGYSRNHLG